MTKQTKRGFTLIELLVVVLIIGILAAVAVPQYQKAIWKSRMAQARLEMQKILQAFDLYDLTEGEYPNGQIHGLANQNFLSKMDLDTPVMNSDKVVISYSYQSSVGKNYPIYVTFPVKHPELGICTWTTPNINKKILKRPLCMANTAWAETICRAMCTEEVSTYYSCAGYAKGCPLL